ncbi:MAG: RusA family crossover junction endodeoxyribonuclease [Gammaproteobacteria bacterium]
MIEFFVPQTPQGKQSPRAVRIGAHVRVVKASVTRKYESMIAMFASQAMAGRAPLDEPVTMRLTVWMPVPTSWSQKKRSAALAGEIRPVVKPDLSNTTKSVEDGCNGIVYVDDRMITDLTVSKYYGCRPGVAVVVQPLALVQKLATQAAQMGVKA